MKILAKSDVDELARLRAANAELLKLCKAASHALRSYQYGNAATDLAEGIADKLDEVLVKVKDEEQRMNLIENGWRCVKLESPAKSGEELVQELWYGPTMSRGLSFWQAVQKETREKKS